MIMKERGWNTAEMGWVLSSFFFGYTTFMVLMGYLADRFGPKRIFGFSVAWWSLFTALTPLPSTILGMAVVRAVMGIGESGTNPATNSILVRWFPPQEYSRATSVALSGSYAGPILAFPLATTIGTVWGWQAIFYTFAVFGALWFPFWLIGSTDRPEQSRSISPSELNYILASRPEVRGRAAVPWKKIVSLPAFWGVAILHLCNNWLYYLLATWLPTYLLAERHFSIAAMGFGSALPFFSAWVGANLFGVLIDRFSGGRNRTRVRKCFMVPFMLTAVVLLSLSSVQQPLTIVGLLCLAMILLTSATPIINSGSLDIAPRYAGTFMGIQNCFANLAGVIVPVVTGYVAKAFGWQLVFWLIAGVILTGGFVYILLGRAEKLID
jgi:MFS family permease